MSDICRPTRVAYVLSLVIVPFDATNKDQLKFSIISLDHFESSSRDCSRSAVKLFVSQHSAACKNQKTKVKQ